MAQFIYGTLYIAAVLCQALRTQHKIVWPSLPLMLDLKIEEQHWRHDKDSNKDVDEDDGLGEQMNIF